MRRLVLVSLMVVSSLAFADRKGDRDLVAVDRREVLAELRSAEELLSSLLIREKNKRERARLLATRDRVREVRLAVKDAPRVGQRPRAQWRPNRYVVAVPAFTSHPATTVLPPPPPLGQPTVYPMPEPPFRNLVRAVRTEAFAQNQLNVVRHAGSSHYFNVAQVRELVALFSFSRDKLAVVEALKGRILDRENEFLLYQEFSFSSDKDALRRILS